MNYAFKGFFETPDAAEAAYYALRSKQLVTSIETSDLASPSSYNATDRIAYGTEGNTMLISADGSFSATALSSHNPRVAMTPFLLDEKQAPSSDSDACYLYGHCRKKDIEAVTSCLKRSGAFSVLTSSVNRSSRLHH